MKKLKGKKFDVLSSNELNELNGGRCVTTHHSFLGKTWRKTVCYNDFDGDKESVCRSSDMPSN